MTDLMQRQSNNRSPLFTDEECMSIYLFGILQKKTDVRALYEYIKEDFARWFPTLPSYQAFNKRICNLKDAFCSLADWFLHFSNIDENVKSSLLDSMPIIVAKGKRIGRAKAAAELCDIGYCASKEAYYYGVKLHAFSQMRYKKLPLPLSFSVTPASRNDLPAGKAMLWNVRNAHIFADKMYRDSMWHTFLARNNNTVIYTPIKLKKGQGKLPYFDTLYSKAVSSVRQTIESFFNWIQVKTNIHAASKVRSTDGLLSFIFARFALIAFLFNS